MQGITPGSAVDSLIFIRSLQQSYILYHKRKKMRTFPTFGVTSHSFVNGCKQTKIIFLLTVFDNYFKVEETNTLFGQNVARMSSPCSEESLLGNQVYQV